MASARESRFEPVEWAAILAIVVVWGVNNAAAKYATAFMPPLMVGGLRFLISLPFLIPFLRRPMPGWRDMAGVTLLTGPLYFGLLYWAFSLSHNLSLLGLVFQLWIPMSAVFAWRILGEPMNGAVLLGIAGSFAGAAVMTLQPGLSGEWPACAVAVVASLFWALGTVLVRRAPSVHPLAIQGLGAVFSAPLLLGGSLVLEPHSIEAARHAPWLAWAAVAFGAIASTLGASALLFWLLQRHETGRVTGYLLATPLITCVLGVVLFGDVLTPRLIAGGTMTLAGVALVALAERRRMRLAAAPTPS